MLKRTLKAVRAFGPLNRFATSAARRIMATAGRRSEFLIKHLPRVGTVQQRLPNGRTLHLWSRGDDWVANQVFWRGWAGYEPETTPLFFRLAERSRVTLDVGAFVGFYSVLAGHARDDAQVYAFEALAQARDRLRRNIALNRLTNVTCVAAAVADRPGEAEFFHVSSHLPTSSSLSYDFMKSAPGLTHTRVPVVTLDRFLHDEGVSGVDLVKIDTETTEPDVLRGFQDTLKRDRPAIVCEVLPDRARTRALTDILRPLDYRFYLLTPEGPSPREAIEGHSVWLNYLFVSPEVRLPIP